jgi:hypothetical protein
VNRWMSVRFQILSTLMIGITTVVIIRDTTIDASYAGLAMSFIGGITLEIFFLVQRFVNLEQSMVAVREVLGQKLNIEISAGGACQGILRVGPGTTKVYRTSSTRILAFLWGD